MIPHKTIAWVIQKFVRKMILLLFNTLSRFVTAFLSGASIFCLFVCLFLFLISQLQSPYAVIFEVKKIKSVTTSNFLASICHEVMRSDAMTLLLLYFLMLSFRTAFSLSSFTFISFHKILFSSSSVYPVRLVSFAYLRFLGYFSWQSWFQLVIHSAWYFKWCTLHIS